MAGLGDKTPVSRLQEFLVSKKMFARYELIHNGVGTHNPCFTYRVQAGALWEEATGRSKREAKHRAAERMLKSLNVIDSTEEKDEAEFNLEPAENYVGKLKELCNIQCYPEPKYYLEESAGPAHCKMFRMICCVSQLQDHGISSTKKQAKQEAAWKMLHRLKELKTNVTDVFPTGTDGENKNSQTKKQCLDSSDVIDKYNSLKIFTASTINKDPTALYKDHHRAYLVLKTSSPTLLKVLNDDMSEVSADGALSVINDIAKELEVLVTTSEIPTEDNKPLILVALLVFPPVAGLGNSEQNAAFNLLNSLLYLCKE